MIENPMYSGAGYPPEDVPALECPICAQAVYEGDTLYDWFEGWICEDCLKDEIGALTEREQAEMSGESVAYTRQMMENASNAKEKAEILSIEYREVEA